MKLSLLKSFEPLPYFTISGFRQILGSDTSHDQPARELLSRWRQAGHVVGLKRGVYMTRRFYELHRAEANFAPAISAILLSQSYVSLEYVLQQKNILTEATYPVTAATPRNTREIRNLLGSFVYRHLQPALYTGFQRENYYGVIFHRASSAKALFDYLYLRPLPRELRTRRLDLAEEMRLNLDEWPEESWREFARYVEMSASEKMATILDNLKRWVWRP